MVTREGVMAVYMMASQKDGTLYTGVTSNLAHRAHQHRTGEVKGFTSRCGVRRLVWYRVHDSMVEAIADEKRIKKYPRQWKIIPAHADGDSLGIPSAIEFRINAAMTNRMAEASDGFGGEDHPDGLHERAASRA
jgi:putative endonuclease